VASVEGGEAPSYDDSVDVGAPGADVCGLVEGTWYFAARAFNSAGLLSDVSTEVSAFVSTGSAQPPPPPMFVNAFEESPGCILISWAPSGDPTVVGYIVDLGTQSVAEGEASEYDYPLDVGNVVQLRLCNLSGPVYYIAVRARNHLALTSAYSTEQVVELTQTPVGITSFSAAQEGNAVVAEWQLWWDERIRALELYRAVVGANPEAARRLAVLDPGETRFVDETARPGTDYSYQLVAVTETGERSVSPPVRVRTRDAVLTLEQNAPNPFNPTTSISWIVPRRMQARLDVFDVTGAHVATLQDGEVDAGRTSVRWDGRDGAGRPVASGTYFYVLRTPMGRLQRKMLLIK
jgi:hypothetical protein